MQNTSPNDNFTFGSNFMQRLEVQSFRGLKDVQLENLKQVNLLVGGNNSGKTSILEAIAVLHARDSLRNWLDVSFVREVRSFASGPNTMSIVDTLSWMFPSNDDELFEHTSAGDVKISAMTIAGERLLHASINAIEGFLSEEDLRGYYKNVHRQYGRELDEPIADYGIEMKIDYTSPSEGFFPDVGTEVFQIWSQVGLRNMNRSMRHPTIVQYIPPYGHRNSSDSISALSRAIKDDNVADLNSLMKSLDPRIAGVELVTTGERHRPQVAIRMANRRLVPISVMGDGIRRALSISLSILASHNGIVLIDEIEAAFHVSAFSKTFNWLMDAAKKYQVQIIATTHSLEAVEGIARSTKSSSDLSAYLIGQEDGKVVKSYTGGMLQRLVVEAGLDIRL